MRPGSFGRIDIWSTMRWTPSMCPIGSRRSRPGTARFASMSMRRLSRPRRSRPIMKRNGGRRDRQYDLDLRHPLGVGRSSLLGLEGGAAAFSNYRRDQFAPWSIPRQHDGARYASDPCLHASTGNNADVEAGMARTIPWAAWDVPRTAPTPSVSRLGRGRLVRVCISVDGGKAIQCYTFRQPSMHGNT